MDTWKFYDITHRKHDICNPTDEEKLDELIDLLRLDRSEQVLDIACGKGEFLIRTALKYGVRGLGVDVSPYYLQEARRRHEVRASMTDIAVVQMDGAVFRQEKRKSFGLASCFGASFVFGGYKATLNALTEMVKPGGWVISGEPYWREDPPSDYLKAIGCERGTFGTHLENVKAGEKVGLHLIYTLVSTQDDFDRYEGLQWYATDNYHRAHPNDPDVVQLIDQVAKEKEAYLRWGRDVLGWAIYVFKLSPQQKG
jgi:SAM-dependent methyltransferase